MPIPVTCPGCSAELSAPDTPGVMQLECTNCQEIILVTRPITEPVRSHKKAGRAVVFAACAMILLGVVGFALSLRRDNKPERLASDDRPARAPIDVPNPPVLDGPKSEPTIPAPNELAAYTSINDFVVSADGTTLATNGEVASAAVLTPGLRVWSLAGGTPTAPREFRGAPQLDPAEPIALSQDGRSIAALSTTPENEAVVVVWDVASGRIVRQAKVPGVGGAKWLYRATFTPDGSSVVVPSGRSLITVVVASGRVSVKDSPEKAPREKTISRAVGARHLAWVERREKTGPAELLLWNPDAAAPAERIVLGTVEGGLDNFVVSADGKVVAVSSYGTTALRPQVALFELPGGKPLGRLPLEQHPASGSIRSVALSANGKFVAIRMHYDARNGWLFRVSDWNLIASFSDPESDETRHAAEPCFSPDGQRMYYVKSGNKIVAIDTETGKETVY